MPSWATISGSSEIAFAPLISLSSVRFAPDSSTNRLFRKSSSRIKASRKSARVSYSALPRQYRPKDLSRYRGPVSLLQPLKMKRARRATLPVSIYAQALSLGQWPTPLNGYLKNKARSTGYGSINLSFTY